MSNRFWPYALLAALCWINVSCNQDNGQVQDTPTSGSIRIGVDDNFSQILRSHVATYEGLYKNTSIEGSFKPEAEVIQDLLNDSIRLAVVTRNLTSEENQVFEKIKLRPRVTKVAYDAIALIVHPDNPHGNLTLSQARQIFTGSSTSWKQIEPNTTLGDIQVVFDHRNSSTVRYVNDSLTNQQPMPANSFAAESNGALIDYVAQNPNAIGVIGVNWISDKDDSTTVEFLQRIKVVGLSRSDNPSSEEEFVQPYQAYIAQRTYPLIREVFIVSREARAGLGTGFASFVAGDQGQRIFLKSGLVPATMPVRIIGVR